MSKQDDIREEVFATLVDSQRLPLKECGETADKILEGISRLGVVVKIDRELPENIYKKHKVADAQHVYHATQQDMLEAGYEATRSLVEKCIL